MPVLDRGDFFSIDEKLAAVIGISGEPGFDDVFLQDKSLAEEDHFLAGRFIGGIPNPLRRFGASLEMHEKQKRNNPAQPPKSKILHNGATMRKQTRPEVLQGNAKNACIPGERVRLARHVRRPAGHISGRKGGAGLTAWQP